MTESLPIDPFDSLPQPAVDRMVRLTKSASNLTIGTMVSIFCPAGFLFVMGFAILRIIQARRLCQQFPILASPHSAFPGKTKAEVTVLSMTLPNLAKAVEFSAARKAYWVVVLFPVVLIGGIISLISILK